MAFTLDVRSYSLDTLCAFTWKRVGIDKIGNALQKFPEIEKAQYPRFIYLFKENHSYWLKVLKNHFPLSIKVDTKLSPYAQIVKKINLIWKELTRNQSGGLLSLGSKKRYNVDRAIADYFNLSFKKISWKLDLLHSLTGNFSENAEWKRVVQVGKWIEELHSPEEAALIDRLTQPLDKSSPLFLKVLLKCRTILKGKGGQKRLLFANALLNNQSSDSTKETESRKQVVLAQLANNTLCLNVLDLLESLTEEGMSWMKKKIIPGVSSIDSPLNRVYHYIDSLLPLKSKFCYLEHFRSLFATSIEVNVGCNGILWDIFNTISKLYVLDLINQETIEFVEPIMKELLASRHDLQKADRFKEVGKLYIALCECYILLRNERSNNSQSVVDGVNLLAALYKKEGCRQLSKFVNLVDLKAFTDSIDEPMTLWLDRSDLKQLCVYIAAHILFPQQKVEKSLEKNLEGYFDLTSQYLFIDMTLKSMTIKEQNRGWAINLFARAAVHIKQNIDACVTYIIKSSAEEDYNKEKFEAFIFPLLLDISRGGTWKLFANHLMSCQPSELLALKVRMKEEKERERRLSILISYYLSDEIDESLIEELHRLRKCFNFIQDRHFITRDLSIFVRKIDR